MDYFILLSQNLGGIFNSPKGPKGISIFTRLTTFAYSTARRKYNNTTIIAIIMHFILIQLVIVSMIHELCRLYTAEKIFVYDN